MSARDDAPHIFGIRHLSPAGAQHLLQFLDQVKPTAVLIEGPADANEQIAHFAAGQTKPPIAMLAYTEELPVRTLLYPYAEYSPEYQALLWAHRNGAITEFIDLPSEIAIPLEYEAGRGRRRRATVEAEAKGEGEGEGGAEGVGKAKDNRKGSTEAENNGDDKTTLEPDEGHRADGETGEIGESVYEQWARLAGAEDHDSYWESSFEHNMNPDAYRLAAYEFGRSLRELDRRDAYHHAQTLVREAYMRSCIARTIAAGHAPEQIVVVCGAYHAPVLHLGLEPMSEEEYAGLPRVRTKLTLMPYSYYRLSTRSGYGAGNHAPAYFDLMWQRLNRRDGAGLPAEYLSRVAAHLREQGKACSSAEVIEGVRLANTLAALHGGSAPTNRDLRDAAVICLGHGELSVVAEALTRVDIGTAIGSLPEGVSRTSIQEDFYRELKRLKLDKYKSAVAMDLDLDLRENRRVSSEAAAFLDLNRSFFLHRLAALKVSFQQKKPGSQGSATWAEAWVLRWTPEAEIELVESTLLGETIELATAYAFKERLAASNSIAEAAALIREACECGMAASMEEGRAALQRLAVDAGSFREIAEAAHDLSVVISYGDIRRFDSEALVPLLQQLFLRGTLLMQDAAGCDNNAAPDMLTAIGLMNGIALEHYEQIDEPLWTAKLLELSDADDRNPLLSGYACSILLERNLIDSQKLSQEVARRLSPGTDADLGTGWFEGLAKRNHYALLARMSLWEQLADYISALEEEPFKRALVFLRRAFGEFAPAEKRSISETLGEIWGIGRMEASDLLGRDQEEMDANSLDDLNDFDFGDL